MDDQGWRTDDRAWMIEGRMGGYGTGGSPSCAFGDKHQHIAAGALSISQVDTSTTEDVYRQARCLNGTSSYSTSYYQSTARVWSLGSTPA
ncbi:hypothetical protein DACRYDRAFT_21420 [Dacryopinax primogenitus]|uniref:Uncharacterized protein n=1 Tax=Dacryopinax primogenitus (strain DJM 731) TaxID=1858805 RepID=M5GE96_DACPD|nr:uncharacterized protein DACRYDRAFT_21420 [Dacryopinax primogenitus]EJU03103.1 hypothetical protein DACRYDRAFT_21420 [Dacryopinax primogenitus]